MVENNIVVSWNKRITKSTRTYDYSKQIDEIKNFWIIAKKLFMLLQIHVKQIVLTYMPTLIRYLVKKYINDGKWKPRYNRHHETLTWI